MAKFENLSNDAIYRFFKDGLTDEQIQEHDQAAKRQKASEYRFEKSRGGRPYIDHIPQLKLKECKQQLKLQL